jgi:ribosomal protein S18 acetylase RimI-like enzyme
LIRLATARDAAGIARVHVETWRDTYAGIVPDHALIGLDERRETARQRHALAVRRGRSVTMIAELPQVGVIGYAEAGLARVTGLPYDAELYTLYVAPGYQGQGHGRALMGATFARLIHAGFRSVIVWVLAENPARFFYAAMGAKQIGVRSERLFGADLVQEAYGWPDLEDAMQLTGRLSRRT